MFQASNVKRSVAGLCAAVLLAGGIPLSGLDVSSVKAANPDTLPIPALKVVDKEIPSAKPKVYNRQEANRASYDARKATTKALPMALTQESSKTYEFKTSVAGFYGFEITEFTQDIKSVNLKLVNTDTNKTVKSLTNCKKGSHISVALEADTNYAFTVSRNSGKKGSAYIRLGQPSKAEDYTSFIRSEEAGILEINDSVVFAGQKNEYTFTADKSGIYAFALKNIENNAKFDLSLSSSGVTLNNGVAGQDDSFTQELVAGQTYTVTVGQKIENSKFTLVICQPKDSIDLGSYEEINDSLDYKEQENVYTLTPSVAGRYRFGISVPDNADGKKHVTLALYEDDKLSQISYTGEEFAIDLKANAAYKIVVSYENILTPYTLKVYHQKAAVALDSGYNKVKDSIEFTGQVNYYTFKAPCDGTYSFYMTDITKISGDNLQTHLTINDANGKNKADKDFGTDEASALTFKLEGGMDYTLGIAQKAGTFKYTLHYGEAKPVQDISNYRYIKDSVQYSKQKNVYTFTAPSDGDYRFQIEDNGKDANVNNINLTVSGENANASVYQRECTEGMGVLAGLKRGVTYKVTIDQNKGYSAYTLVVGSRNERTITPTPTPTPAPKALAPSGDPKEKIKSFVDRIYMYVLDREPEEKGAAYWADELYAFRRTGAEVAQGFIFSPEFENRKTSDRDFVTILYKTFFSRDPEENGMNYWLGELARGKSRVEVANGFIFSQEWADTCASYGIRSGGSIKPSGRITATAETYSFVERMYTTAMCREYDENGRQYWADLLANFEITGEQVGTSFFLSEEMNNYKLSDQDFLKRLYATFMDRESDKAGEDYWLGQMSKGKTRKDVVLGFTRSPEFTNKCVEARILPY